MTDVTVPPIFLDALSGHGGMQNSGAAPRPETVYPDPTAAGPLRSPRGRASHVTGRVQSRALTYPGVVPTMALPFRAPVVGAPPSPASRPSPVVPPWPRSALSTSVPVQVDAGRGGTPVVVHRAQSMATPGWAAHLPKSVRAQLPAMLAGLEQAGWTGGSAGGVFGTPPALGVTPAWGSRAIPGTTSVSGQAFSGHGRSAGAVSPGYPPAPSGPLQIGALPPAPYLSQQSATVQAPSLYARRSGRTPIDAGSYRAAPSPTTPTRRSGWAVTLFVLVLVLAFSGLGEQLIELIRRWIDSTGR